MRKSEINSRVKDLRAHFKLTQEQMADILEIKQSTYARIELYENSNVTLDHVILLFEKLNVNPNWIIIGEGNIEYEGGYSNKELGLGEPEGVYMTLRKYVDEKIRPIEGFLKYKYPDYPGEK